MAKKARAPDYQKSFISNGGKAFFRVYESLFASKAFQELPPSVQVLYIAMGIESKGQTCFTFPFTAYIKIMPKETFRRSKQRLIESGFIEIAEEWRNGTATLYKLSSRWKNSV